MGLILSKDNMEEIVREILELVNNPQRLNFGKEMRFRSIIIIFQSDIRLVNGTGYCGKS